MCVRYFPEARSFAAWTCDGLSEDERFTYSTTSKSAVYCVGTVDLEGGVARNGECVTIGQ